MIDVANAEEERYQIVETLLGRVNVVNTASRLQGHAAAGEVLLSARLAHFLPEPVGVHEQLVLKGKQELFEVRRVRWFARPT